jgi:O-antigen/teichoic acid export membrane protein
MTRQRDRRIILASGAGLLQRCAQLATAVVTLPLALHALGVAGFGVWGAATSLVWLSPMLDFGLGSALVTLLPRAAAAGRAEDARLHVATALLGGCLLAVALLCLGGCVWLIWRPAAPFMIAGIGLALNIPLGLAGNLWFGLQKGHVAGFWDLVQTLLTFLLLLAAVFAGAGVVAMTAAVYGGLLAANAGSLAHFLRGQPGARPLWRIPGRAALWAVAAPGGLLFMLGLAGSCAYGFDTLLALHWLGPPAAAQMTVALRVCTTAASFLTVVTQPLWPAFVEAAALDDRAWEWRTLRLGTLAVAVLGGGGSAALVLFGPPAMRVWLHGGLPLPPSLFWAMGAWILALSMPRVAGLLLNAVSILRWQILAVTAAAALGLGLKYVFAAQFGPAGMLAGTALAWLVVVWPGMGLRAWQWTRRPAYEGRSNASH